MAPDGPPSRWLARRQLELRAVISSDAISNWTLGIDSYVAPEMARSALVVIDTQVDFVDGGSMPVEGTTAVLPNIVRLLGAFRTAGRPIVHVVRLYDGDEVDLVRRAALRSGARIARPELRVLRSPPNYALRAVMNSIPCDCWTAIPSGLVQRR
jgi:Isochorismatase family